ncbi:MAG: 50S ribosomal protein L24 [Mycoplasmoidaceae bacterium]
MQRIKTGDKVRIISGKLLGKEGTVLKVCPTCNKAIVEGLNVVKVHKKAGANQEKGGIKEQEAWIPLCKLALVTPKAARGVSKISYKVNKDGKKVRVAKATGAEIGSSKKAK